MRRTHWRGRQASPRGKRELASQLAHSLACVLQCQNHAKLAERKSKGEVSAFSLPRALLVGKYDDDAAAVPVQVVDGSLHLFLFV